MANKDKVTALITAESIIAGFMIAYGTLVGQMLMYWSQVKGASLFTTFQAGLLASAVVLTCFRSVLLLFKSLDAKGTNNVKYKAGYDLFIVAILGSCLYVIMNVASIYNFTLNRTTVNVAEWPLAAVWLVLFSFYAAILLLKPAWIQKVLRCLIRRLGYKDY